ncbi:winged helix-turn-helix domain-containing protein [Dokdonella sp.]|uniref:winged helix-turn-helix domain-containing protein n=1 Tax=Dokdonella sp. TaxID=2291710 RepID=UPI001B175A06|nr:winged helix-turn-helix domain-containing protein [Dokdonella sp.]MBO9662322.1 winged helix-turn-helix domain-containing protein [Dokdonella sp.]
MHYRFGPFRLNPETRELRRGDARVALSRRGFDCLLYLIEHRERACGRDELVRVGWGDAQVTDAQLGQVILRLRRSLGDDGQGQQTIRTVTGFGYCWVAETECLAAGAIGTAPAEPAVDVPALEAPSASATPTTVAAPVPRKQHRWTIAAALALLAIALSAAFAWRTPSPAPTTAASEIPPGAIVLPLAVTGPADSEWIRLGGMALVIARLREAGVPALQSESVLGLLADGGRELPARHLVVRGSARLDGAEWQVVLDARNADGSMQRSRATHADPAQAARQAADLLAAALGHVPRSDSDDDGGLQARLLRSQAALFSNQLDSAREILLDGSEAEAAQPAAVRYRLAQIDYRAGRLDRAESALSELLADPAVAADERLRAQVLCARATVYVHRDRYAEAERDFDAAVALAREGGRTEELGRALNGRGAARVALQKFDHALADLGQARIELGKIGDELGVARVDNNSGALEAERAHPAQALPFFAAAAARFAELGALNEQAIASIGLADTQALLLRRSDALATAERGWALRDRLSDPSQRLLHAASLADAQLAVGRERDAAQTLHAVAAETDAGDDASRGRLRAVEAELAWRQQRYDDAIAGARAALRAWPVDAHDAGRAGVALILQRALIAGGQADPRHPPSDPAPGGPAPFDDDLPAHALASAEWAGFVGRGDDAERGFGRAVELAEARGVPAEIVEAVAAQAPRLLAAGRRDEAAALVGRVAAWSQQDYDSALLQLRLFHASGDSRAWREALTHARALAGERTLPSLLAQVPAG